MKSNDRRYRLTEELIRDTYRQMLREMPVDKITVAELCRRAEINRGTFYLHYKDCYELLEQLEDELANTLSKSLEGLFDNDNALKNAVETSLKAMYNRRGEGHILFFNDRSRCLEKIGANAREEIVRNWMSRSELSETEAEIIFAFISGGCNSVARELYSGGLAEHAEEYTELVFRLMSRGIGALVRGIDDVP